MHGHLSARLWSLEKEALPWGLVARRWSNLFHGVLARNLDVMLSFLVCRDQLDLTGVLRLRTSVQRVDVRLSSRLTRAVLRGFECCGHGVRSAHQDLIQNRRSESQGDEACWWNVPHEVPGMRCTEQRLPVQWGMLPSGVTEASVRSRPALRRWLPIERVPKPPHVRVLVGDRSADGSQPRRQEWGAPAGQCCGSLRQRA